MLYELDETGGDDYQDWPDMLRTVRELIGTELALKLSHDCGGIERLYIPHRPSSTHPWQLSVGLNAFRELARVYGGQRVSLPRGAFIRLQKRQILELAEQGVRQREIALRCHVTERYVRRVLAGFARPEDARQLKLF